MLKAYPMLACSTLGFQLYLRNEMVILSRHLQEEGTKAADSAELTLDDPGCLCKPYGVLCLSFYPGAAV